MLPLQRAINRIERRWRRAATLERLYDAGPAAVYGGLLHYAQAKNYKAGWAAHSFKEIFGTWPRPQDRAELKALPDSLLIEEWAATRQHNSPAKRGAA
jgi:hypothetical protein